MKKIIYTAVALIICASVFGIADYINAKKQDRLVNYTDDEQTNKVIVAEKKNELTPVNKEEILIPDKKEYKKDMKEKKIVKTKMEARHYTSEIPDLVVTKKIKDADMLLKKVNMLDVLQAKATDENKNDSIIPDNKRRINLEMFSRAPIREKRMKNKK